MKYKAGSDISSGRYDQVASPTRVRGSRLTGEPARQLFDRRRNAIYMLVLENLLRDQPEALFKRLDPRWVEKWFIEGCHVAPLKFKCHADARLRPAGGGTTS